MQGTNEINEKGKDLPKVEETSIDPKMIEVVGITEVVEINLEDKTEPTVSETVMYNPSNISTTVLPQSNNFVGLIETVQALEAMHTIAAVLVKSNLCPLKKEADVILAIITGNQFSFPYMTSINNIYAVNGKPTLSAHLHRALLLMHKLIFKKVYDYEALYDWAKTDEKGTVIKSTTGVPIILGRFTIDQKPKEYCVASSEKDRITKYEFKRMVKQLDNTYETMIVYSEFKMSDASKADLLDKDNWKKYPARMCDARAFTTGAREIAADITLGIYSVSELADQNNLKYRISESFEESLE